MSLRLQNFGIGQAVTDVLFIGFNQDASFLCVGTTTGFDIYSCTPFTKVRSRVFRNGGISIVEMMHVSNIFALVGGGPHPCFHTAKVVVWDESKEACLGEVPLPSDVRGVRMRRDKLVVALDTMIYIFSMNLECEFSFDTSPNPQGLLALSFIGDPILANGGMMSGQIRVQNLNTTANHIISAHNNPLGMLACNLDGTLLASVSTGGTVIKVHNLVNKTLLKEVRRGSTAATVYSVCFSRDSKYLACVGDSSTVHIFSLSKDNSNANGGSGGDSGGTESSGGGGGGDAAPNRKSRFAFFGNVVAPSLFDAEWSFAWYTCPTVPALVAFAPAENELMVSMWDGTFLLLKYDRQTGGECACIARHAFATTAGQSS